MKRNKSPDKGRVVRRQIGVITTSIRRSPEPDAGDSNSRFVQRPIGGFATVRTNNNTTSGSSPTVVRRQIGVVSVRINNNSAASDSIRPHTIQRPIGGFTTERTNTSPTVVRRQIGVVSVRINNNSAASDSIRPHTIQRPIGGFTTERTNSSSSSSNSDNVVQRHIGGFTSVRTNSIQRPIGGFSTKRSSDDSNINDGRDGKRPKVSEPLAMDNSTAKSYSSIDRNPRPHYHPIKFITWNCNGFTSRAKWDFDSLQQFVTAENSPDVICIQEARLKADGNERGRPLKDKFYEDVQGALDSIFCDYTPFWSLADKKYAGTLTLVKFTVLEDAGVSETDNSNGRYDSDFVAFTPRSAIDLILRRLGTTREECGLEMEATAAALAASPVKKKAQQTSLKSFFSPKAKPKTSAKRKARQEHHPEGRFQFFFFPGMDFVQTYVPNNGTKDESFARRRYWDKTMLKFVQDRKQILQAVASKTQSSQGNSIDSSLDRKILWCGKYKELWIEICICLLVC